MHQNIQESEQSKIMKKPKHLTRGMIAILIVVCGILYSLADRYLIQHVEVANVSAYTSEVTQTTVHTSASVDSAAITGASTQATTATLVSSAVQSDDWNYQSEEVTISIREVVTGSGSNKVTYFVADVQLADATQLQNAFANNSFGRNIIDYTSTIAEQNNAIFAINGDYYGFRTDGIVIRNGVIYREVPARMGLAFYKDGTMKIYDETQTSAQALLDAGVWNTLSFGPALVENGVVINNNGTINIDTNLGNHPVSGNQPRTGIGIIDANHFIFVVVDGRSTGYSRGVSLDEFAQIFKDLGCTDAYNIDGGGSSTMYFLGRVVNNPLGRGQERGTSDILFIGS
jgi:exopolysaccharide biosynthesis protein